MRKKCCVALALVAGILPLAACSHQGVLSLRAAESEIADCTTFDDVRVESLSEDAVRAPGGSRLIFADGFVLIPLPLGRECRSEGR